MKSFFSMLHNSRADAATIALIGLLREENVRLREELRDLKKDLDSLNKIVCEQEADLISPQLQWDEGIRLVNDPLIF